MKKIKSILILIIILMLAFSIKTYAAEGSFSLSKTSVTLTEGSNTTFSIKATNCEGKFTITSSNSNVVKVSSSSIWVTGSESVTLTAVKDGTAEVTITASDVGDTDENTVSGSKTISVTVKEKTTSGNNTGNTNNNNNNSTTTTKKSNNANLKTLGVTPKEYDFSGFSKSKTSYSVTIPNNVDSLKVAYKTEDSKASVKVSGDSGFEVGSNNQIKVVVTAEDGKTTKTYTIKVTKLAEDEEKPGNIIDDNKNDGLYLTSLNIKGIELSPKFAKDTFSYTATLSDSNVNELEVEAKANNEKANIAISGNTNLEDGENTINIILTLDDSSEQTIYQIVVNKETTTLPTTTSSEITPTSNNDFMGSIKTYIGIVIAVILLVIIAIIVLIVLLRKENKKLRDEGIYDEEYDEELSKEDKETLEEINKQTNEIFKDKVQGQSVEYGEEDLEERKNRRDKGRHF